MPRLRREALQDPRPELRAVPKNEVQDRDGNDQSGDETDPGLDAGSGVAGGLLPGIRERRLEVLRAIEGQVERVVLEPVRDVVDGAARDGLDELVVLGKDGRRHDRDQPRYDEEPSQKRERGRRSLKPETYRR